MKISGIVASCIIVVSVASGCSGTSERNKIDYKSAGRLPPLEIPPDLATPENSDRYNVPTPGEATYSDYSRSRESEQGTKGDSVLPERAGMRVVRVGEYRWLEVDSEPGALWQPLREFWQEAGFLIASESPELGIMETDWAENRAKVPLGAIQRAITRIFDNAYSLPERDKFRTRIEHSEVPGRSEIFISHRGIVEVLAKRARDNQHTIWQAGPRNPELEAEMLYRVMARLGGSPEQIEQAKAAPPPVPRAALSRSENVSYVELTDSFDRAWRRVGLALDRIGFTVEDRDRSQGVYFVRYIDPDAKTKRSGLARLAFWRSDPEVEQKFRIRVIEANSGSEVRVLNNQGDDAATSTKNRILALLRDELK